MQGIKGNQIILIFIQVKWVLFPLKTSPLSLQGESLSPQVVLSTDAPCLVGVVLLIIPRVGGVYCHELSWFLEAFHMWGLEKVEKHTCP